MRSMLYTESSYNWSEHSFRWNFCNLYPTSDESKRRCHSILIVDMNHLTIRNSTYLSRYRSCPFFPIKWWIHGICFLILFWLETDARFRLTEDLVDSEREFLVSLRTIYDIYARPLRKLCSISEDEQKQLFGGVEPVLSVSNMLLTKVNPPRTNTHTLTDELTLEIWSTLKDSMTDPFVFLITGCRIVEMFNIVCQHLICLAIRSSLHIDRQPVDRHCRTQ